MKLRDGDLSIRMRGDDVKLLHDELQKLGSSIPDTEIAEGVFGQGTEKAVKEFQEKNRLQTSGIVDQETATQINREVQGLESDSTNSLVVKGRVVYADGRALADGLVRAFDKDLRSEEPLGETNTDGEGRYKIGYGAEQFRRAEQDSADLIVRAYNTEGRELANSPIVFNAQPEETIDLVVGGEVYRGPSEYDQLVEQITPLLQGLTFAALTEDEEHQDVTFLSGETGEDPHRIAFLIAAHRLAERTDIAPEIFYGLFRNDLPPNLSALLIQDPDLIRRSLELAVADNLIPVRFAEGIDELLTRFRQLLVTEAVRPVEEGEQKPPLVTLLGTVLADRDQQATFIERYINHSGPIEEFWDSLRTAPELAEQVDSLQFGLQVGALTGNHLPLVRDLQRMRDEGEDVGGSSHRVQTLRDLVYVDESKWRDIIQRDTGEGRIGVPAGTPGKDEEEQRKQYARTLSRIVERNFPTAYVAARLEEKAGDAQDPVLDFLIANVDTFEMDGARLETYLAEHRDALAEVAQADRPQLKQRLRAMQRVYRVAPRYEAMSALLEDGIDSAQAIVEMGRELFALKYGHNPALDNRANAYQVYGRAEQTHAMALAIASDHGMSRMRVPMKAVPDQRAASNASIPDWQTLFGSLELCDCEHCRSVYSPAAYLVDLLHFLKGRELIDPRSIQRDRYGYIDKFGFLPSKTAGKYLTAKEVLFQRRSDLGRIELTCANTNTPLPYVDLVNEALEDFIATPPDFSPFELSPALSGDLDQREVSQPLKTKFAAALTARGALTKYAIIEVVEAGKHWRLHDCAYSYDIRIGTNNIPEVKMRGRQTSGSKQELAANPQYLNPEAYTKLQNRVFPLTLPFDLWDAEVRTYLDHLGVQRHRLMDVFLPGTRAKRLPSDTNASARTHLGLTITEAKLITGTISSQTGTGTPVGLVPGVWNLWGFATASGSTIPDPADSTGWIGAGKGWLEVLTGRVDVFLQQSGLAYKEMLGLLGTYFVNPLKVRGDRLISLTARPGQPDDTCETKRLCLTGMDQDAALRALRFIRLWRKLGWSMQDLDRALTVLGVNTPSGAQKPTIVLGATGATPINDRVLTELSNVQWLHEQLGIALDRLLPFWGDIDSALYIDHDAPGQTPFASLYERLFRNKQVINPPDAAFTQDPSELTGKLSAHRATIAAALGLGAADLGLLLADPKVLPQVRATPASDDTLSLENLSTLYRHATLAKALGLSARNYLIAVKLSFSPFPDSAKTRPVVTAKTIHFVEQVQTLSGSSLTLVELDYLSRHQILESDRAAPTEAEIARELTALRSELRRIGAEHRFEDDATAPGGPTVDLIGDLTRSKLALLGWEGELIDRAIATFNDLVTYRVALASLPADVPKISTLNDDPGKYEVSLTTLPASFVIPSELKGIVTHANGKLQSSRRLISSERKALLKVADELHKVNPIPVAMQAVKALLDLQDGYLGAISYDVESQELRFVGVMNKARRNKLQSASNSSSFKDAVNKLYETPQTFIKRNLRSCRIERFSAQLTTLPNITFPAALRDRIVFDAEKGYLYFVGAMTEEEQELLLSLSTTDVSYQTAIQALSNAPGTEAGNDAADRFLTHADVATIFDQPKTPPERFEFLLKILLQYLRNSFSERATIQSLAAALDLETQTAGDLLTNWLEWPGKAGKRILDAFLDEGFTESDPLVEVTDKAFQDQFDAYRLLHKSALVLSRFECTPRQARWLFDYDAAAKWPDLNALPVAESASPAAPLESWVRLVELFEVRNGMSRGEEMLDELLALAGPGTTASKSKYIKALQRWTQWSDKDLKTLLGDTSNSAKSGQLEAAFPVDYVGATLLARLRDCFALLDRTGLSAADCVGLVADELDQAAAQAAKEAARSKYDETRWLEIALPLRNALRERQRAALVAYLLSSPDQDHPWRKISDVYGWFLLDVEMSPCQLTSRIKQAISSVQLFIQRCLMGLEPQVLATAEIDNRWREWRWMKNYRVWEANRKIFLYPENWIEPELRDDKTPFFKALEGELLQTNLTKDTATTAFRGYLDKLDDVARLEVVGMYHERSTDMAGQVVVDQLHVFGRTTAGKPYRYYYRRRVEDRYWTCWESVDLDIGPGARDDSGLAAERPDHLIPVTWRGRLFLIWPIFTENAEPQTGEPKGRIRERWKIQLAWSEYKDGKWAPKCISDSAYTHEYTAPSIGRHWFIFKGFTSKTANGESTQLVVRCYLFYWKDDSHHKPAYRRLGRLTLGGCKSDFVFEPESGKYSIACPHGALALGMILHQETGGALYLPRTADGSASARALAVTPKGKYRLLYAHQHTGVSGLRKEPWFFNDDLRTYWVVPKPRFLDVRLQHPDPGVNEMMAADWSSSISFTQDDPFSAIALPRLPTPMINPGDPPLFEDITQKPVAIASDVTADVSAGTSDIRATDALPLPTSRDSDIASGDSTVMTMVGDYVTQGSGNYPVVNLVTSRYDYSYRFHVFYHPHVCRFVEALNRNGVDGLLQRPLQLLSERTLDQAKKGQFESLFEKDYEPTWGSTAALVDGEYPEEKVDFGRGGAYSQYNWELFFHAPLLIADSLRRNQRFEDAQRWFHYIFDPTDSSGLPVPQRYWRTKPFYLKTKTQYQVGHITLLLRALANGGDIDKLQGIDVSTKTGLKNSYNDLTKAVEDWREDPFKPHLVARMRTTAYQKTVVMKYLDNLIEWGDQLFRRDTMESINEATQLYVLAADILGKRPDEIPSRIFPEVHTYDGIEPLLGEFSNALVQIEEFVPSSALSSGVARGRQPLPSPTLYFCVPKNDELLAYWDKVADRLFKIRHCMNIEGVVRQLPLFAPPINPALLVKAAAAGLDIGSVLADVSAPFPHYRFQVLSQKTTELCGELKSLGAALLSALEKRDAEKLALLRAEQETALLELAEAVRKKQVDEAEQQIEVLEASREIASARYSHYQKLLVGKDSAPDVPPPPSSSDDKPQDIKTPEAAYGDASTLEYEGVRMINREESELDNMNAAKWWQLAGSIAQGIANLCFLIPNWKIHPWGVGQSYGGSNIGQAAGAIAAAFGAVANEYTYQANLSARMASHVMRGHDWFLQGTSATKEIAQIDQQIIAAHIRKEIAEQELSNHKKQIEHSKKVEKTLRDKYTNEELYGWMIGQVSGVYFQSYQLAYDLAKRAERAFRHELGLSDSSYIRFGYWDSLRKGLLAGERLTQDLKRMEVAYLDRNRRELEITKHLSLVQLDPVALIELRETGKCVFEVPEVLFDLDYPGHYMRRIKSASLTIPCVTGPYAGVSCTLTLVRSSVRHSNLLSGGKYARNLEGDDPRFTDKIGAAQSIVTSSGRDDSGLFETNLRDERFLPFEGAGAISTWQLELPTAFKPFDYDTVTDVVLHLRYTARSAGGLLKKQAVSELNAAIETIAKAADEQGLARLSTVRHEFPDKWSRFLHPTAAAEWQTLTLALTSEHFPYLFQGKKIKISKIELFLSVAAAYKKTYTAETLKISLNDGDKAKIPTPDNQEPPSYSEPTDAMLSLDLWNGLLHAEKDVTDEPGTWTIAAWYNKDKAYERCKADALENLLIVCHYTVS